MVGNSSSPELSEVHRYNLYLRTLWCRSQGAPVSLPHLILAPVNAQRVGQEVGDAQRGINVVLGNKDICETAGESFMPMGQASCRKAASPQGSYLLPVKYQPFRRVIPILVFLEELTAWKKKHR